VVDEQETTKEAAYSALLPNMDNSDRWQDLLDVSYAMDGFCLYNIVPPRVGI
jgi:hypothetical protein